MDATLEDHPGLTRTQVVAVAENVRAYPKSEQPYPAQSFKRMLGELADLGAFDPAETDIEGDARPAR